MNESFQVGVSALIGLTTVADNHLIGIQGCRPLRGDGHVDMRDGFKIGIKGRQRRSLGVGNAEQ